MNNDQKCAKVIQMIDDLYGDSGMAVVNLVMDYMSEDDWGTCMTDWSGTARSSRMGIVCNFSLQNVADMKNNP